MSEIFERELQRIENALGNSDPTRHLPEGSSMKLKHFAVMAVVLAVGYYLGTKYPNLLQSVKGAA